MKEIRSILQHYQDWAAEKIPLALATVVNTEASSYRRIGARMLVGSDGRWVGGISGGCLEGDALRRARTAIFQDKPSVRTYDTREGDDPVIGVGLGCEGKIDVLFTPLDPVAATNAVSVLQPLVHLREPSLLFTLVDHPEASKALGCPFREEKAFALAAGLLESRLHELTTIVNTSKCSQTFKLTDQSNKQLEVLVEWMRPEIRLLVVGDNYDTLALGGLCQALGWELHLIGLSRKFGREHHQLATTVTDYAKLDQLLIDAFTAVILMSHDYQRDLTALKYFLPLAPTYLGLLGPAKRRDQLLAKLKVPTPDFLFAPVGLDLGAESPEEIALSICAEVTRHLHGASGDALKYRQGSIHSRAAPRTTV